AAGSGGGACRTGGPHMGIPTPLEFYWKYRSLDVQLATGLWVYGLDVHEYRNAQNYFKHKPDEAVWRNDHDITQGMGKGWYPLWYVITVNTSKVLSQFGRVVQVKTGEKEEEVVGKARNGYKPMTAHYMAPVNYTEEIEDYRDLLRVFDGKGSPRHIAQA